MYNYTPEQQRLIEKKLASHDTLDGFVTYEQSERIHTRNSGQVFAVFGIYAYELFHQQIDDDEITAEYLPVVIDGKSFGEFPEEGRSGVLHLFRISKYGGNIVECPEWQASYISCGWLRTKELELSATEIIENITDEIDAGATHLTSYSLHR